LTSLIWTGQLPSWATGAGRGIVGWQGFRRGRTRDALGHLAGAAAGQRGLGGGRSGGGNRGGGRGIMRLGGGHAGGDGGFVVVGGVALDHLDGVGRAGGEAVAETVAVGIGDQLGLAVDQLDGAFVAGADAQAAAVAEVFIDGDDFAFHAVLSWVLSNERARPARVVCFMVLCRRSFSLSIRWPRAQARPAQILGSSRQRWGRRGSPPAAS
jgi:hypothetical protein